MIWCRLTPRVPLDSLETRVHDAELFDELFLWERLGLTPAQAASLPEHIIVFIREFLAT